MINLLLVASESTPFVKAGGMADVVGGIARFIDRDEFDCRVIIPDFRICREPNGLSEASYADAEPVCRFDVHWGVDDYEVDLLKKVYDNCLYYFVHCDHFFSNEIIYTNNMESIERFVFFQKAVIEAMPIIGFKPDVICGNDWEGGMLPVFVKSYKNGVQKNSAESGYYDNCRTALLIHNIAWQGEKSMRIGVENADAVITVSETYRNEIISGPIGEGLQDILAARQESVYAIQNGADFVKFNPESDPELVCNFERIEKGKFANKIALQRELGLDVGDDKFLIATVSRMVEQKGLDIIEPILDDIMSLGYVQLVFLGDGEARYLEMLKSAEARYPGRIAAITQFEVGGISHRIYARADAYLMPSRFEPSGISQLIAMRYGTVPIVRLTGGLRDTVTDEVGFGFERYEAQELLDAVQRAEQMYREDRFGWNEMANRAMQEDNSFERCARGYEALFRRMVAE